MILTVNHVTTYRYEEPMRGAMQSLRLFPANFEGQKVLEWEVDVQGGVRGGSFRDGAGDKVEGWSVRGPLDEVSVTVRGRVDTVDTAGVLRGLREVICPEAYLRGTKVTEADLALTDLARSIAAETQEPLDRAHRLADAVAGAIDYVSGSTQSQTSAAEALAQGKGVCQDHAHALIACALVLDMPARYVSGYLYANKDGKSEEAAHAWAEIHVPGLGWVGFDAANACCPDERYIRLGSGFDARLAAPIRGVARGGGAEVMEVAVAVVAAQQ